MSEPDLTSFDLLLDDGDETHGYVVSWEGTESEPFTLVIEEQTLPQSVSSNQEDENYGFRDLQDAWRVSYTNFTGGEGQYRRDVSDGALSKYWKSSMVDTSLEGDLRLHHRLRMIDHPYWTNWNDAPGIVIEHQGKVCYVIGTGRNSGSDEIVYYDPATETFAGVVVGSINNPSGTTVSALASDGYNLYYVATGGTDASVQGIFRHTNQTGATVRLSDVSNGASALVDRMCWAGGYLYLSSGGSIGYLKGASEGSKTFEAISPVAMTAGLTCFGMVASGTWVYWGVSTTERTYIYRVQYDGTNQLFEQYAKLPGGFVGTALFDDGLGNIYAAGYFRSNAADVSQGIVYMLTENGIALLCKIGDDPNEVVAVGDEQHNKIIAGYAHDHYLYLVSERALYRWDVRKGGLNHIGDVATFAASGGSPGVLTTIPWGHRFGLLARLCQWCLPAQFDALWGADRQLDGDHAHSATCHRRRKQCRDRGAGAQHDQRSARQRPLPLQLCAGQQLE